MRDRFPHDRLLIVAAIAAWVLAAPGVSVARTDDAQVTVVDPSGNQRTLSLAALGSGDVVDGTYTLRSADGESTQAVTGFSPAAILAAAGADPYGFSYLELQRPAGGSVLLSRHQALDPGAFPEGPPVVYATATGTGFLRPSGGPADLNATDSFEAPQGITIVLRKGSPLQVRAQASTVRTRPGRPVTFSAIVDRAGAGEQLTYSWYFDDGSSSTGARTRHRFSKRGSYDVVVGVTTAGDETGASAVVTVQVGPPLGGPDRKGGGTNEDVAAPDHGAAHGNGGGDTTAAGTAAPSTPATRPAATRRPPAPKRRPRRRSSRPPPGRQVSGELLSAVAEPTKPRPVATAAARTGKLDGDGGAGGVPETAIGIVVTLGLLGLGALAELRSPFATLSATNGERGAMR